MKHTQQNSLIFPARYFTAPEFRAANNTFGGAYSGPEQRQRKPHHLTEDPWPHVGGPATEYPGMVIAL